MEEQFTRTELLIGKEAMEKLKQAKVAIFGIGGVGSFVIEGLARAGVQKFVLVDHDVVDATNLNRQIIATTKTIGKDKVDVAKERILEINPNAQVEIYKEFFMPESEEILDESIDYIVDAIDTVTAKIELVVRAKKLNIPIISSMGTGNKLDPTKFEVTDIYKTSVCPLAKVMRKELRARQIKKLKVVYSKEEPIKPKETCEENSQIGYFQKEKAEKNDEIGYFQKEKAKENDEIDYFQKEKAKENDEIDYFKQENLTSNEIKEFRSKKSIVPGSISFVPSVAGLIVAGEVIKDLINNN